MLGLLLICPLSHKGHSMLTRLIFPVTALEFSEKNHANTGPYKNLQLSSKHFLSSVFVSVSSRMLYNLSVPVI